MNESANRLAHGLRNKYHVQREDKIVILAERSEHVISSLLGVLKSGAAFVPVDPESPAERVSAVVEDCGCKLVITDKGADFRAVNPGVQTIDISLLKEDFWDESPENPFFMNQPADAAYVIYTSGSTGKPKGVIVEHRNICSMALAWINDYRLHTFKPHVLQLTSMAFDVFIGDLCRALLSGGCMTVCPEEQRFSLDYLAEKILFSGITVFDLTPALAVALMNHMAEKGEMPLQLKLMVIGSDVLSTKDYCRIREQLPADCRVINSYGTTETTVDSSFYEDDAHYSTIKTAVMPIGKPVTNTTCYILNSRHEPAGIGSTGELYIGGSGVARGYINHDALTKERFLPDPFIQGGRMYKTGDMAYWLPDGNIQFSGRADHQVKIRGFRVELDEVQGKLESYEGIGKALAVAFREGENTTLIAYYQAKSPIEKETLTAFMAVSLPAYMIPAHFIQVDEFPLNKNGKLNRHALPKPLLLYQHASFTHEIRAYLNRRLPGYMVPSNIIVLPEFPLTSSGKIDRKRLPPPHELVYENLTKFVAPRNDLEKKLVAIWQDVLLLEKISITDNFFDLGGHSLKGMQLISRVYKEYRIKLPLKNLFINPTIEVLAAEIETILSVQEASLVNQQLAGEEIDEINI